MHLEILKKIGTALGELVGIDASFEFCNNVRLLVKCRVNSYAFGTIKIITNSSIYNINYFRKDTEILEMFRLDTQNNVDLKKKKAYYYS